ncbi:MAG: SPASM domain-containing protein [Candidatus Tectimicrobiota bacterium]
MMSPHHPDIHLLETAYGPHLLFVDGSRLYAINHDLQQRLEATLRQAPEQALTLLAEHGLAVQPYVDSLPLRDPPVRALSLAVAQQCNLGCTYCYAQGGSFGGVAKAMPWSMAEAAVHRLLAEARAGERVHLAFLGGEPLTNRALIVRTTELAAQLAAARGVQIGFAITTNGTLLTAEDGVFFARYGFAVTVSLDGIGKVHDRLRPFKGGLGSYRQILARVQPLLAHHPQLQIAARVTVTPANLDLPTALAHFIALGFHSVGFAPMLASPGGHDALAAPDLQRLLQEMLACGRACEAHLLAGRPYPFANLTSALQEIHRGTHRPYPCGAGAGYFGVSADGGLFACHRFVNDPAGQLGTVDAGVNRQQQRLWLTTRHVHTQEPCRSCWARYLCGGGCYHEVQYRGRPACDFIRGWLHYCLQAYIRLIEQRPEWFTPGTPSCRP